MPVIGMNGSGMLQDRRDAPQVRPARTELPNAGRLPRRRSALSAAHGCKADITVSTDGRSDADRARQEGLRCHARRQTHRPLRLRGADPSGFSIQSARYAEKHRQHAGVDLAVYYHPAHAWNVDRMLDALAASLDYYQANFGPYQFHYARIVEFPGYRYYSRRRSPAPFPYSETLGFISDYRNPDTLDYVTCTTAHELAHQYWAHQVIGADTEGAPCCPKRSRNIRRSW